MPVGPKELNPQNPLLYSNPVTAWVPPLAQTFGFGNKPNTTLDARKKALDARRQENYQPGNPYWNLQGKENDVHSAAYDGYYKMFGHAPSTAELAQLAPAYSQGIENGDALAGQMYQMQENTPAKIAARQQKEWAAGASQHYGTVAQSIKGLFGRDATQEELDHYGTALASGQVDPYTIQEFLKSQPEYQNAQDAQFRSGLDQTLQDSDQKFFGRAKEDVISRYAQMGRPTSPALDVALTELASQLSERRGTYLAGVGVQQYGGNKNVATQDYEADRNNWNANNNNNVNAQYQDYHDLLKRTNDQADTNAASDRFNAAMDRYGPGRGAGPLDYLNTGLNVVNTGLKAYSAFA